MAGTLTALYLEEMRKANVEPIVQVDISLTQPSGLSVYLSNAHHTTSYDVSPTPLPIIISVTDVSAEIDPVKRHFQIGTLQIEILNDPYIRTIMDSHDWFAAPVLVTLGTPTLTSSDYATIFYGQIERVYGQHDRLFIDCTTVNTKMTQRFNKAYSSKHPMEVLHLIMNEAGIADAQIDTASLASDYIANYSHYCFSSYGFAHFTRGGENLPLLTEGPSGGYDEDADYVRIGVSSSGFNGSTSYQDIVVLCPDEFAKEYCELTGTVLYNDTASKVKLNFADKTAAVYKHITVDEYWDFEQDPEMYCFNRVKVNIGGGNNGVQIDLKDAASIAKYGEHVYSTTCKYFANAALNTPFSDTKFDAYAYGVNGFCGARNLKAGTQTSADVIDGTNPFYGYYRSGLYKTTTAHTDGLPNSNSAIFELPNFTDAFDMTFVNGVFELAITGLSFLGGTAFGTGYALSIYDITMAYQFCERILDRYSNTAPKISFILGLEHVNIELGDTISIDNDWFVAPELDLDGLDSNTKFEITKKEIRACGSDVGVSFEACYLTTSSPPSVTVAVIPPVDVLRWPIRGTMGIASDLNSNSTNSVLNGLSLTATSGRGYRIDTGAAICAGAARRLEETITLTATASKDTYVGMDSFTGNLIITELSPGATEPDLSHGEIRLGKVVCGASSVSSIADYRRFGAIGLEQLDLEVFQPGNNILWNPNFENWPNIGSLCPSWAVNDGTFGTHIVREESTVYNGSYGVEFPVASGALRGIISNFVPVSPGQPYRVSAWVRGTNTGDEPEILVKNFQNHRESSSAATTTVFSAALGSAGAWLQKSSVITTASDTRYIRLLLNADGQSGTLFFDDCSITEEDYSFNAIDPATTAGGAGTAITKDGLRQVFFTDEAHDYGGNFDPSSGGDGGKFIAPTDGIYELVFTCKVTCTGGEASSFFGVLYKNGAAFKENMGGLSSASGLSYAAQVTVSTGPVELSKGDYVTTHIYVGNRDATLQTNAEHSYFSGRRTS